MKIKKAGGKLERRILSAMITDKTVLAAVAAKWEDGLFGAENKWANLIAKWCIKYYRGYEEAPREHIETMFNKWAKKTKQKETATMVESFLSYMSGEYEEAPETNSKFLIDLAGELFNGAKMEDLTEQVNDLLDEGRQDEAYKTLQKHKHLELGVGAGIDLFFDKANMDDMFAEKDEVLLRYPSALGEFFSDACTRAAFIAFMGPEKRGKSWWLLDAAFRASILQRKRVAFFEAGDNSERQVTRRFYIRAAKHPRKACDDVAWPTGITFPESDGDDESGEDRIATVDFDYVDFKKDLTPKIADKARKKVFKKMRSKNPYLKLSCHPNSSLSLFTVESILQTWSDQLEWVPDVIVIDYADILDMTCYGVEGRDRINETWKHLRRLSQKFDCLVITATQADASSYTQDTINRTNFSDDKRKIAHVTGMVGLNQTDAEKDLGIYRLNWLALRESKYTEQHCVHVASCLELGNPAVRSCWQS